MEEIQELIEVSRHCGQFAISGYVHNTGIKKKRNSTVQKFVRGS
jgi:hypothetical protein